MEMSLCHVRDHWAMFGRRRARFVGGGLIILFVIKKLHRMFVVRRLRKKVEERRRRREEEFQTLTETLLREGPTIDERAEILSLSLTELRDRLQNGELSALTVLRAYQSRALEVNRTTNCLVGIIKEAEELAKKLDSSRSKKGPLHGIPVSIKESFSLAGYNTTLGFATLLDNIRSEDAVMIKVLIAQGAVPFVRTNVPQSLMSSECSNPVYGVTLNPHDLSRSPGGSSGGEAALIAGEGSLLGMGSDIGGSIRIPSNMCGTFGLKPTYGRLSSNGMFSLVSGQTLIHSPPGPIARDVDSLVVAMDTFLSPPMFELDPRVPEMFFNHEMYSRTQPLRIGYFLDTGVVQSTPASQRAVLTARDVLHQRGHTMVQFEVPRVDYAMRELYAGIIFGDHGQSFLRYFDVDLGDPSTTQLHFLLRLSRPLRWLLSSLAWLVDPMASKTLWRLRGLDSVEEWWQIASALEEYRALTVERWKEMRLDALICPGFPYQAPPSGFAGEIHGGISYTAIFNVLDFPAGSLPVTKVTAQDEENLKFVQPRKAHENVIIKAMEGTKGLPVNVQCVALPFREELILRVMKELETGLTNHTGRNTSE